MDNATKIKVLVAEDDVFLANAYKIKLEGGKDFDTRIATDGNETLKVMADWLPDVVVLDLIMPRKDGYWVLAQMRSDDRLRSIPVLVASNLGQSEDIDRAMEMGANDYIVKSDMSLEDLILKLKKLVAEAKKLT